MNIKQAPPPPKGMTHTCHGTYCRPLLHSRRSVAGGVVVDIEIDDPRSTILRATVNEANLRDIEWPIGTTFPNGRDAHLPTMCQHRRGVRSLHGMRTLLCYEHGTHTLRHLSGAVPGCSRIGVAGGTIENVRCERHTEGWAESYYGGADPVIVVALADLVLP